MWPRDEQPRSCRSQKAADGRRAGGSQIEFMICAGFNRAKMRGSTRCGIRAQRIRVRGPGALLPPEQEQIAVDRAKSPNYGCRAASAEPRLRLLNATIESSMNSHPSGDAGLAALAVATVSLRNKEDATRGLRRVNGDTQA